MITGILQRRWQEQKPVVYDKETRIVCLDIKAEARSVEENGEQVEKDGFSFCRVEIDRIIDYGHIKSQLIEAGFPQKEEFAMLMNAVNSILTAASGASSWAKFKEALDTEDVSTFADFMEYRKECAEAAAAVVNAYK